MGSIGGILRLVRGIAVVSALCGATTGCGVESDGGGLPVEEIARFTRAEPSYSGVRQVEVFDWESAAPRHVAYRERVVTDGAGRFSAKPVEPLSSIEGGWDSFVLDLHSWEAVSFRYRDFDVRDEGLFARNYRMLDLGTEVEVAGRRADAYRVERRSTRGGSFELAYDRETGVLLRSLERDADGRLVAAMEFETFAVGAPPADVIWHGARVQETPLDWRALGSGQGSQYLAPRVVPAGFELREAVRVDDGAGSRWLRLTYLDGVEPLFFVAALPGSNAAARFGGGAQGPEGPGHRVVVSQLGDTRVAQGFIGEHVIVAAGRVAEAELLDLIESALP